MCGSFDNVANSATVAKIDNVDIFDIEETLNNSRLYWGKLKNLTLLINQSLTFQCLGDRQLKSVWFLHRCKSSNWIILTIQALHDRFSPWPDVDAQQGRQQVEARCECCRELQGVFLQPQFIMQSLTKSWICLCFPKLLWMSIEESDQNMFHFVINTHPFWQHLERWIVLINENMPYRQYRP